MSRVMEEKKFDEAYLRLVGNRVRKTRKFLKLTQDEFASATGVSPALISCIENGDKKPNFRLLFHMWTNLGINIEFIITGNGNILKSSSEGTAVLDIHPDLQSDPDFCTLVKECEVPVMYHSLMAWYLKARPEMELHIKRYFEQQEEAKTSG